MDRKQFILEAYQNGATIKKIAFDLGCCYQTVRKILVQSGVEVLRKPLSAYYRHHTLDVDFFKRIDTEAKAYWLGFLCAEAHIWRDPKRNADGNAIQLGLAVRDGDHVEAFRDAVGSSAPIYGKNPGLGTTGTAVQVCSKQMVSDLARHGVVAGSLRRFYPSSLPIELRRHYFRGLFDGDGGFCPSLVKRKRTQTEYRNWELVVCGCFDVVEAFAEFTRSVCNTKAKIKGPTFKIYYFGVHGNRNAMILAEALYAGATVCLERKHRLYMEMRERLWPIRLLPHGRLITWLGETRTIPGWAKHLGITHAMIYERLKRGFTDEEALTTPSQQGRRLVPCR